MQFCEALHPQRLGKRVCFEKYSFKSYSMSLQGNWNKGKESVSVTQGLYPNLQTLHTVDSAVFLLIIDLCAEYGCKCFFPLYIKAMTQEEVNIPPFKLFFNSSAALYLCLCASFSVLKFRSQNKQSSIKHTTGNIVIQPSDRFVCRSYMSQQLILIPLTTMLCLGVHFPLITWLRDEAGGEGWESKCDRDFLKSGRLWTAGPPVRVSRHSKAEISAPEKWG